MILSNLGQSESEGPSAPEVVWSPFCSKEGFWERLGQFGVLLYGRRPVSWAGPWGPFVAPV